MARFLELPPEIVILLSVYLRRSTLNSLARSNRQLCNLLSPCLYKRAVLDPEIPISYAILNDQPATLELLLAFGGPALLETSLPRYPLPLSWPRPNTITPLYAAVISGRPEISRLLIRHGAKPNPPCAERSTYTPLHVAAIWGFEEVAEVLLDAGADLEASVLSITPLYAATLFEKLAVVRVLLERGANTESTASKEQATALAYAAKVGNVELARVLLEFGAKVQATDEKGRTVLHRAVASGDPDLVELLLKHGADPEAKAPYDGMWVTPWEHYSMAVMGERRERVEEIEALLRPRPPAAEDGAAVEESVEGKE